MRIHQNLTIDRLSTNSLNFNSFLLGRSPSKLIQGFFNLNSLFVLMLFSKRYADLHIKLYTITSQSDNKAEHITSHIGWDTWWVWGHSRVSISSVTLRRKKYKIWSEISIKRVQFRPFSSFKRWLDLVL